MTRAVYINAFGCACAAFAGCLNPGTTRLPTLATGPPAAERRSFEHFDPYADDKLGPETNTRPPSFENNREPQRKAIEGQLMEGAPVAPVAPGFTTGAYRDSDVVR
jgi:hypothetical protein